MSFLSARSLSLSYPGPRRLLRREPAVPVLRDLSFAFEKGERIGLVGVSGCGKSSLLRCLLAMEHAQTGEIHCGGRPVAPGSVAALPTLASIRPARIISQNRMMPGTAAAVVSR